MTTTFAENLQSIASIEGISAIELYSDRPENPVSVIENRPGQKGSLAVYCHLARTFGSISPEAAARGIELYAEHAADAQANPGKHPNIDRLYRVIEDGLELKTRIVNSPAEGN